MFSEDTNLAACVSLSLVALRPGQVTIVRRFPVLTYTGALARQIRKTYSR